MKIDPPIHPASTPSINTPASSSTSPAPSHPSRLASLDKLIQQLPPQQKHVVATVQANSTLVSKAEQANLTTQSQVYQVLLKVGGLEFKAMSPIALLKGQKVELEINPLKGLEIKRISIDKAALLNDALKLLTPKQESLQSLFSLASRQQLPLAPPTTKQEANIQQQLKAAVSRLLTNTPSVQSLQTPKRLQQALKLSGNFQENQLKQLSEQLNRQTGTQHHKVASNTIPTPESPHNSLRNAIGQDLKARLKSFESELKQLKESIKTGPSTGNTQKSTPMDAKGNKQILPVKTDTSKADATKAESKSSLSESTGQKETTKLLNAALSPTVKTTATPYRLPFALRDTPYFQNNNATTPQQPSPTRSSPQRVFAKDSAEGLIETLIRQTQGALAKIQLNQVASLSHANQPAAETTANQQWFFEVPVNTGTQVETVSIFIEEEKEKKSEEDCKKEKRWQVNLGFDLEDFGKLHVALTLVGESASSTIWVEQGGVYRTIQPQLFTLQTRLEALGIKVEKLDCRIGLPAHNKTEIHSRLIDIKL
ncbi:MAG: flagellar hook-length control protein FliK [Gammaproteobacteria bacterium]|nr:flagellar hook-length control protein FliK [Gammaproteobacteria bacterium]